ncbi:efflux RND transporter periplasmic adaptor subunit [Pontibacter beigongshangensis]|uniref:efflux RND transporter periplasmic adaptor subunit n=1 Tax=Pontibacter beigongshangensis TaxID=2574733 RepID=UPI00164F8C21|nr:efflux RND transporter periplasmic adaptor subunit [Pontibacter beigongshangensis]
MNQPTLKPILIRCLLLALLFNSCSTPEARQPATEPERYCLPESFKSKISLEKPEMQSITEGIPLAGVVEPNPDKVVHFVSLVSGVVTNTRFSLGDKVTRGQVLAELRSAELADLQSQARTTASQMRVAEKKRQSVQSMFDDGIASERDLMEAESELDVLRASLEKIKANLSLFSASPRNEVFQIKAPSTGIITSKSITSGMQISAGDPPLFTISDLSEVWIQVNVYASNVMHIESGMKVNISTLSYPDEVFTGEIAAISQVLDAEARVLKARVVLQNKNLKLKPGMIVDVTALKQISKEALSIPAAALVFNNSQNYVMVYKGDCDIEIRSVDIIAKSNGAAFLSGGLQEGEEIISQNHLLIYEQIKNLQN